MTKTERSGLTRREAERLSALLAKWTEADEGLLEGGDRDAIGQLRHLLADEID